MKQPLLVLDVHYLAHRAFHTSGDLTHKGISTGVIFGILKSIGFLKDEFQTDRVAFCFEHPRSKRRDLYPDYKRKRNTIERTDEEKEIYLNFVKQIVLLRERYLPMIGFKNIFSEDGMESDDIMAYLAATCEEEVILVTADKDMLQCLSSNVTIYSPQTRTILTKDWFVRSYKIPPRKWAVVKAIAGCDTDEVKGVPGVGEITALKYLKGELKESSKAYQAIRSNLSTIRRNRQLVQLPFKGCSCPALQDDVITKKGWLRVCDELGMKSMASHPPVAARRLMRV